MNNPIDKISIIIPVFNEEQNIKPLVERIHASLSKAGIIYELIFVDDHSTDQTKNFISNLAIFYPIILVDKKGKNGKAFSIYEGIKYAQYDAVGMIDADLQYAPENFVGMLNELENSDVVVANRKHYRDSTLRKIFSKTFRLTFGRVLFGLDHDIQSGLKVFTRQLWETVKFMPQSPWTFDLEFLHRAKQAGFKIQKYNIIFYKRKNGKSNVSFVKQTAEIGFNALRVRAKRIHPAHIPPSGKYSMLGAGVGFRKRKYITHTTIPHNISALKTATLSQKLIFLLIFVDILLGLYISPLITLQVLVGLLSAIYFADVLFNLYLITKSLGKTNEITSTQEELGSIKNADLPVYTILCPLYREARVIPQFLDAIEKISWPKDKLDVILLLEEDDVETIEKASQMDLPKYVRTLIVPHSIPKTKPKACNFGLGHAKGEYIVVYDAEDIPDPLQLKKAYLGFKKAKGNVICLQAKLNYYNSHQNLLTRLFTAEYSHWFDLTLPGLVSIDTTLPLGGTSNHFRIESLRQVHGWDPFNVTEDADLGVRLFKKGYKTAMIDSETLEEANSKVRNWLRQRSRWIKGYMQTYLVHTRGSTPSLNGGRGHSLIFHLVVGGKLAFVLINPFLWLATFSYFALYAYVGPAIEAVYPTAVFYMAVFSLVFGNFLFLYYYMIGLAKKGQWHLVKFVFLIPIYWVMLSLGAFIALYQLILKPHYWEKTIHGFHLEKAKDDKVVEVVREVGRAQGFVFPRELRGKLSFALSGKYLTGGAFVASIGIGNFLNFLYNAYLGRVLNLSDFALVSFFSGLLSISYIIASPFGKTVNYKTGYLIGRKSEDSAYAFWKHARKRAIYFSIFLGTVWLILSPLIADFFRLANVYPVIAFLPVILFGITYSTYTGFLSSHLRFGRLALLNLLEPSVKLGVAAALVFIGLKYWAFSAVPISIMAVFTVAMLLLLRRGPRRLLSQKRDNGKFPSKFFMAALISSLSTIAFLSFDVVLAKHFLTPEDAGRYALVSLIGKMVFFLGSFATPFIMPLVARNEGANKNSGKILRFTLLATIILSGIGFIGVGILGGITTPILFGEKVITLSPYLIPVAFAMFLFSVSRVFNEYYLAKKYYIFSAVTFLLACLQVLILLLLHASLTSFVMVMVFIWSLHFILTFTLHLFSGYVRIIQNNIADFFGLFGGISKPIPIEGKLRILIFNWRDTKHKWAGGAEVYIQELSKRWVKDGNTVTIFCGNDSLSPRNEVIDGVNIVRRGGFYTVYVWGFLYFIAKFRGYFDVIVDCENGIPFFTPFYTRTKKFLLIHHVHQGVFRKRLKPPMSFLGKLLESKLMPLVYQNTQIITVSPSSKEEILRHKLTKIEPIVVYNGVDAEVFKPAKKSENPMILYLGRLQYYKSLDVFIVIAQRILKNFPNAEFVIAGEGEERVKLEKFAQKLEIADRIKFVGHVSEKEKIKLLQRAWVFVNPSYMEGWGLTVIEAAACATPAVASDVPGLKDSVNNLKSGILIKHKDYSGFTASVAALIRSEKLRNKMSGEAVKWSKNFSWDKSSVSFLKVVSEELVLEKAKSPGIFNGAKITVGKIMSLF